MATDDSPTDQPQRPKRKWYKDKTYIFMIGVFAIASCLLIVQAQQQQFNRVQENTGAQLLVGQNQTLILVNKTAAVILGNDTALINGQQPIGALEGVRNLLTSINQTLSNPNRTIKTSQR